MLFLTLACVLLRPKPERVNKSVKSTWGNDETRFELSCDIQKSHFVMHALALAVGVVYQVKRFSVAYLVVNKRHEKSPPDVVFLIASGA